MMSFRGGKLEALALSGGSIWLLTDIAEFKGRARLYTRQAPQLLKTLRESALIESAESSNRIEGVTVDPARLVPLVIKGARQRDRSEEEVQAYRKALDLLRLSVLSRCVRRTQPRPLRRYAWGTDISQIKDLLIRFWRRRRWSWIYCAFIHSGMAMAVCRVC